jgi:hypothetical protein
MQENNFALHAYTITQKISQSTRNKGLPLITG